MRVSSSAIGCSNSRKVVFTGSVFYRDGIERLPQVPGRHRAPRAPQLALLPHPGNRYLAPLEVGKAQAFLQAQVVERIDVGAQQVEHQEHLRGPAADAA